MSVSEVLESLLLATSFTLHVLTPLLPSIQHMLVPACLLIGLLSRHYGESGNADPHAGSSCLRNCQCMGLLLIQYSSASPGRVPFSRGCWNTSGKVLG